MKKMKFTFFWSSLKLFHITPHFHLKQFPDSMENKILKRLLSKDKSVNGKQFVYCTQNRGKYEGCIRKRKRKNTFSLRKLYKQWYASGNQPPCVLPCKCTLS